MWTYLFAFLAYLFGSVPFGLLFSKAKGRDPRLSGSKNIGATNVARTVGKGIGILTLIADTLKGFLPVFLSLILKEDDTHVLVYALSTFFGHLYPIYLRFRGGKGVAVALGIFLAISPLSVMVCVIIFSSLVFFLRYVSVASLSCSWFLPVMLYVFHYNSKIIFLSLIIAFFITLRHRENVKRLIEGKEHKIFAKGGF